MLNSFLMRLWASISPTTYPSRVEGMGSPGGQGLVTDVDGTQSLVPTVSA